MIFPGQPRAVDGPRFFAIVAISLFSAPSPLEKKFCCVCVFIVSLVPLARMTLAQRATYVLFSLISILCNKEAFIPSLLLGFSLNTAKVHFAQMVSGLVLWLTRLTICLIVGSICVVRTCVRADNFLWPPFSPIHKIVSGSSSSSSTESDPASTACRYCKSIGYR